MKKELSDSEIKAILEKIRAEYRDNAKLNPKSFDLAGFEKRYLQVLQLRTSVTSFLSEEVAFLEQLKAKIKSLAEKKELQKAETLNRILDENMERLSSYSKIDFHVLAKPEIKYFYGALVDFCNKELPVLLHIFKGTPEYSQLQDPIMNVERVGLTRRGLPSVRIQEFIKQLMDSNGNSSQMERFSQVLLKETSLSLKALIDIFGKILNEQRILGDSITKLNEKQDPHAHALYNGKSYSFCIESIRDKCKKIIMDFRMSAIVGLDG